jgi:hypothetical protein
MLRRFRRSERNPLSRFFSRNPGAFLSRFGETDGDRLFAALHFAALASSAGAKSAMFLSTHGAGDGFPGRLAVSAAALSGRHEILLSSSFVTNLKKCPLRQIMFFSDSNGDVSVAGERVASDLR